MSLSTYSKFSNAVIGKNTQEAEKIFGDSDIRCDLIAYSLQFSTSVAIVDVLELFQSTGLRDRAIQLCENCTVKNCKDKQMFFRSNNTIRITNTQNILTNNKRMNCE